MKIKRLVSIGLAVCLTLVFSATAFAATPSTSTSTSVSAANVSPLYPSPNPPPPGYVGWAIVTAQPSMIVRSGPGSNYSNIGTVLYGDSVYCYSVDSNEWAYIGNGGYVSAYYLIKQ
ncbi:SH3 domain-containing protein [Desulfosporosinus metallidurans]|uniref:SH3 domain-containing protein n=1 Tax=Desulfosporosinus metallidurans TaxID=1888891 RepID=UPI00094CDE3A|nr:SH3 domain-containing protein [Desulfosporosinus metallidurans]